MVKLFSSALCLKDSFVLLHGTYFSLLHIISLYDYLPFLILAEIELLLFLSYYEFHINAYSNSYIVGAQGNALLLDMLKSEISESK